MNTINGKDERQEQKSIGCIYEEKEEKKKKRQGKKKVSKHEREQMTQVKKNPGLV